MSPSSEVEVVLPAALHARPAAEAVRAASIFTADVQVCLGERSASARSALRLMSLGANTGATVTVRATGDDAALAALAVAEVLRAAQ
ncbi:HPr family phosphocarrier protein [Actinoplanes xinjiangensis]|uniref:HPr family phosphocarrier protein n=1 Tax=Actinoplanes xinjiangensis TaxID=512350 RepID=UPI003413167C